MTGLPWKLGFAALLALTPVQAAAGSPVVVELFTSQGCSSCPPANANLAAIAARPDILALSFGVTYWDQLGWKDTFARDEFTRRQYAYAGALHGGPYTPQIVVNGIRDGTGIRRRDLDALIAQAAPLSGPALSLSGAKLRIGTGAADGEAQIWLVQYDPRIAAVPVSAGENAGVTLAHRNVVKKLERLGAWRGEAIELALPPAPPGLLAAVLVQRDNGGAILSALKLP